MMVKRTKADFNCGFFGHSILLVLPTIEIKGYAIKGCACQSTFWEIINVVMLENVVLIVNFKRSMAESAHAK